MGCVTGILLVESELEEFIKVEDTLDFTEAVVVKMRLLSLELDVIVVIEAATEQAEIPVFSATQRTFELTSTISKQPFVSSTSRYVCVPTPD